MRRQLATLTGIRGVAAVWVVCFHAYPFIGPLLGGPDRARVPVIRVGYLAVDLFFVLSGFVLSLAYFERFQRSIRSGVIEFFFARIWRIAPLHWFCLAIFVLLFEAFPDNWWGPGPFTLPSLAASALLVQDWSPKTALGWNHPTWSLSAEWLAYLLFPVIAVAMSKLRDHRLALGLACISLLLLATLLMLRGSTSLDHVGPPGLIRCLCEFSAGALTWKAWSSGAWAGNCRLAEACVGLGAILLALAMSFQDLQLTAPFAFMLLILGCALSSRTAGWIFANRVAVFLGDISFSIYLVHIFLLGCLSLIIDRLHINVNDLSARFAASAVYPPFVLATAYMTWRFVERPCHDFARAHAGEFSARSIVWLDALGLGEGRRYPTPETSALWLMRLVAMALGVAMADFLATTLHIGDALSAFMLLSAFVAMLAARVTVQRSSWLLAWALILCATMVGSNLSDFLQDLLGFGGSLLLLVVAPGVACFAVGPWSGEQAVCPKIQIFYWTTFLLLNALGTTVSDFLVDDVGLGYSGAALVAGGSLACLALGYVFTKLPSERLFWLAVVLARSLSTTVSDTLTTPHVQGGLQLGTAASAALLAIVLTVLMLIAGPHGEDLNGSPYAWRTKEAAR